ncbi:MAG TPA: polysaccharide deacetylase family protein [Ignavibacteriales bacterium]|nr:polysaccharide deacetylase family protein [Ignavibacteriales bacterium]
MKFRFTIALFSLIIASFFNTSLLDAQSLEGGHPDREVAITFDDLPAVSTRQDINSWDELTDNLLSMIKDNNVPAVGFVIESHLYDENAYNTKKAELLNKWLDQGLELGNHTYSHPSLNRIPLQEYENDLIKGEATVGKLLSEHNMKLRYFRHPFLQTGRTIAKRDSFNTFLSERGYTVAPVTIDNSDWIFARAYDNARDRGDKEMMKKVADAYIPYMESKFEYFEKQSVKLFGREVKQVLLVHANTINSEHFGEIARMLKNRGYKFITLQDAISDSAYKSPDTFTGAGGISWLHRWAYTKGHRREFFAGEPETPEFVMKEAGVTEE